MDRLLRLAASGSVDLAEVKAYGKANRKAILKEMIEFHDTVQPPREESYVDWAKRMNAEAREKWETLSNKEN
jgi:hypothetical protein